MPYKGQSNFQGKKHSSTTIDKIRTKMMGNKNNKEVWTLEAATELMEKAIELTQKDETFYFIGTLCKHLGTNRHQLDYLLHEKYRDELRELTKQLHGNIEANLFQTAAEKKVSDKMATLALRNFFDRDWNKATDKKEIENKNEMIVWHEVRNYAQIPVQTICKEDVKGLPEVNDADEF